MLPSSNAAYRRRGNVQARLAHLERFYAAVSQSVLGGSHESVAAEAREKIRENLKLCGVQQQPSESLAEATARALGISVRELKIRLEQGAVKAF